MQVDITRPILNLVVVMALVLSVKFHHPLPHVIYVVVRRICIQELVMKLVILKVAWMKVGIQLMVAFVHSVQRPLHLHPPHPLFWRHHNVSVELIVSITLLVLVVMSIVLLVIRITPVTA